MDTFSTKHISRPNLQAILNFLDSREFEYTLDNHKETITFDSTELSQSQYNTILQYLGKPIQESKKLKSILRPIVTEILREIRNKKK